MKDDYVAIGETAGKIYRCLQEQGEQSASKIQKAIAVTDTPLFNQALGWLAREEKISFNRAGKTAKIALCSAATCS